MLRLFSACVCSAKRAKRPAPVRIAFLLVFLAACHCVNAQQSPALPLPIAYHLTVPEAGQTLRVSITLEKPYAPQTDFAIPAWTPGYYQILDFEKGIGTPKAVDETGHSLTITHPSARVWRVATPQPVQSIHLTYEVTPRDSGLGFFGTTCSSAQRRAYVNGASAFLYVNGQTDRPVTLDVTLPKRWKLASPLAAVPADSTLTSGSQVNEPVETTRLQAHDYDEMIDAPLQMGRFDSLAFKTDAVDFQAVIVGSGPINKARLAANLSKIAHEAIRLFGAAPFRRYVFFYHLGGDGFMGGLEHRNSTVIHLWTPIAEADSDNFLAVTAHEFFHAWNVKRDRPAGLGPFDYTRPVRTASLWWAEGVTDYYAQRLLALSGLRDGNWFLNDMAERLANLAETPSRTRVSLEKASRNAWEGGSMGYDGLSYYLKGSLIGLYFDLRIRALTDNRKSLDDAMRLLDQQYGAKNIGYSEDALLKAINTVSGQDLSLEYDRYVRGTSEIDWSPVLMAAGPELLRMPVIEKDGAKSETYTLHALTDQDTSAAEQKVRDSFLKAGGVNR